LKDVDKRRYQGAFADGAMVLFVQVVCFGSRCEISALIMGDELMVKVQERMYS